MDGYKLIDTHTHSRGVSLCARATCKEIIDRKIELGYQGAILTNHCQSHYYPQTAEAHAVYIEKTIAEYRGAAEYAKARGFTWMLGIEVTVVDPFYSDWLLFGVTEEFLRNSPCLYALSQRELFAYCEKWDVVLVQAHPWRGNLSYCEDQHPGEREFMRGVELNCSDGDLANKEKVLATAKAYGVLVTCGTDYHGPERTFVGGMYVPEKIQTSVEFAEYLRKASETYIAYNGEIMKIPNFSKKAKKV